MFNYDIGGNVVEVTTNEPLTQLPYNKSLFAVKLTQEDPPKPKIVSGLKTVEAVFKEFKPSCKVELTREDGVPVKETLVFSNVKDFELASLTSQSNFLRETEFARDAQLDMLKQLGQNKQLAKVVANPETKQTFINALKALAAQLEGNK